MVILLEPYLPQHMIRNAVCITNAACWLQLAGVRFCQKGKIVLTVYIQCAEHNLYNDIVHNDEDVHADIILHTSVPTLI